MEFDGIRLLESAFLMLRNLQGRESKIVLVRLILKSKIMFIFSYHSNKKSSSYMDDMGRKCECPGGMSRKSRPMETDTINEGKIVLAPNERSVAPIAKRGSGLEKKKDPESPNHFEKGE